MQQDELALGVVPCVKIDLPHEWVTSNERTWCVHCGEVLAPCKRSPYGREGVARRIAEIRDQLVSEAVRLDPNDQGRRAMHRAIKDLESLMPRLAHYDAESQEAPPARTAPPSHTTET